LKVTAVGYAKQVFLVNLRSLINPVRKHEALTSPSLPAAGRNKELMLPIYSIPGINARAF
jgi:hypothetical protein